MPACTFVSTRLSSEPPLMEADFGSAAEKHRDEVLALQDRLLERRDRRTLGVDEALLLRDIDGRYRAGREPALDRLEHPVGSLCVVARDPQAILRAEDGKVGVRDRSRGGERHHIAIEAARFGEQSSGPCIGGVEPPEIDLVARGEPERKEVAGRGPEGASPAVNRAGRGRARGVGIGIERRIKRGAGDLGLCIGLHDPRDRRRYVQVPGLRIGGEPRQLGGTEFARPIDRRGRRRHLVRGTIGARRLDPELRNWIVEQAAAEQGQAKQNEERPRFACMARPHPRYGLRPEGGRCRHSHLRFEPAPIRDGKPSHANPIAPLPRCRHHAFAYDRLSRGCPSRARALNDLAQARRIIASPDYGATHPCLSIPDRLQMLKARSGQGGSAIRFAFLSREYLVCVEVRTQMAASIPRLLFRKRLFSWVIVPPHRC